MKQVHVWLGRTRGFWYRFCPHVRVLVPQQRSVTLRHVVELRCSPQDHPEDPRT